MAKRAKTSIDESGWTLSQELRDWAAREVPSVDLDRETPKFMDYWLGNGRVMANWDAVFRNWMRRAPQMGGALLPRFPLPSIASLAAAKKMPH